MFRAFTTSNSGTPGVCSMRSLTKSAGNGASERTVRLMSHPPLSMCLSPMHVNMNSAQRKTERERITFD
jgi:hypothetical protein